MQAVLCAGLALRMLEGCCSLPSCLGLGARGGNDKLISTGGGNCMLQTSVSAVPIKPANLA